MTGLCGRARPLDILRCFATLEELQAEIVHLVTGYDAATLHSLTAYPYIMHAINAVCA